jgi:hypothetical protein
MEGIRSIETLEKLVCISIEETGKGKNNYCRRD